MAVFNYHQTQYLQKLVETRHKELQVGHKPEEVEQELAMIYEVKKGLLLDPYIENIKDDIRMIIDNADIELTDEQFNDVVGRVADYDYSDYNEYVLDMINNVKGEEE